ncbi:IQ domain-containing protein C [Melanotaenia boesemani]|uniref:IQ domain-containing protein C n=1 Tax=Melanotaenia boesemani TaxID=1250792 RepID=UPI001C0529FB|nr:IQ domain-containing protein C [Melanotaenia boesemani]
MDRSELEKIVSRFQACARGYLMRSEVRRARENFEDIVKEIDGSLNHLTWTDTVISIPRFTDIGGPCLHPGISSIQPSRPGLDVNVHLRSSSISEKTGDLCVLLERKEAERDDSHDCVHSCSVSWDEEEQKQSTVGNAEGEVMESTGRSSTIWSSLELDMNSSSHKGRRKCCSAQEVPHTQEALRLHRNTLTMELLWLQQAIDSRKKYLSLKDRLSVA